MLATQAASGSIEPPTTPIPEGARPGSVIMRRRPLGPLLGGGARYRHVPPVEPWQAVKVEGAPKDVPPEAYQCLFCGQAIEPDDILGVPALLFIGRWDRGAAEEKSQQFWCHPGCFRSAVPEKNRTVLYCLDADFYE